MRAASSPAESWRRRLVAGPPLAALLFLFAAPTLIMVVASFQYPDEFGGLASAVYRDSQGWHGDFTWENYGRFVEQPLYLGVFARSLGYAAAATLLCALLGYPLAWLIATSRRRYRDALVLLVILPFWSNFLIRVYAWMMILGPQGALAQAVNTLLAPLGIGPVSLLFTPFAVLVGLTYVHLPFMVLPLYASLEKHDPDWLKAARDLGATPWQAFWRVTLPLSLPGLLAGSALVFIPALGAFAVPDLLGGTRGLMIGNLITQQFLAARDWPFGAALAILLAVVVVVLAGGASAWARRKRWLGV